MKVPSQVALIVLAALNVPSLVQGRAIPGLDNAEQASDLVIKRDASTFGMSAFANLFARASPSSSTSNPKTSSPKNNKPGSQHSEDSDTSYMSSSDGQPEPQPDHTYIPGTPPSGHVPPPANAPTFKDLAANNALRNSLLAKDGKTPGRDPRGVAYSKVSKDRVTEVVPAPDRFVLWSSPASGEGVTALVQDENNPTYAGKNVLWFYRPKLFTEGFAKQAGAEEYPLTSQARQSAGIVMGSTAKDVDVHVAIFPGDPPVNLWAPAGAPNTGLGKTFRGVERGLLPATPMVRMWQVNQLKPKDAPVLVWADPDVPLPAGYKGPAPDRRPRDHPSWGPTFPVDTVPVAIPDYPVE